MPRKLTTLTYRGETLTLTQWAERLGCRHQTLGNRLRAGWPTSTIITTPVGSYRKKEEKAGGGSKLSEKVF